MLKRLGLFVLFVFLFISLILYQRKSAVPVPSLLLSPIYYMNGLFTSFGALFESDELANLRKENQRLKIENMRLRESAIEAERLRQLLFLKENTLEYFTSARVISRGAEPWSRQVVIDKGANDSVRKDMAVVTPEGLLGKVQKVFNSYSIVLLIDDPRFRAGARLQASRAEGIYEGKGGRVSSLKYIEPRVEVGIGEVLITSGLDGIFPPGIGIGYVSKVSKPTGGLFQEIEITPFADTGKVEEVALLR